MSVYRILIYAIYLKMKYFHGKNLTSISTILRISRIQSKNCINGPSTRTSLTALKPKLIIIIIAYVYSGLAPRLVLVSSFCDPYKSSSSSSLLSSFLLQLLELLLFNVSLLNFSFSVHFWQVFDVPFSRNVLSHRKHVPCGSPNSYQSKSQLIIVFIFKSNHRLFSKANFLDDL